MPMCSDSASALAFGWEFCDCPIKLPRSECNFHPVHPANKWEDRIQKQILLAGINGQVDGLCPVPNAEGSVSVSVLSARWENVMRIFVVARVAVRVSEEKITLKITDLFDAIYKRRAKFSFRFALWGFWRNVQFLNFGFRISLSSSTRTRMHLKKPSEYHKKINSCACVCLGRNVNSQNGKRSDRHKFHQHIVKCKDGRYI